MKNTSTSFKTSGFTLIEILIVVALIGALFLGILAAVDPLEQLKKGGDASKRELTNQIYNGLLQYYSTQNTFPWSTDVNSVAGTAGAMTAASTGYLTKVVDQGELKPDFINLAGNNLGKIFLTSTADAQGNRQNLSSCFLPDSKAFRADPNSKYIIDGTVTSGCSATSACYWCIK